MPQCGYSHRMPARADFRGYFVYDGMLTYLDTAQFRGLCQYDPLLLQWRIENTVSSLPLVFHAALYSYVPVSPPGWSIQITISRGGDFITHRWTWDEHGVSCVYAPSYLFVDVPTFIDASGLFDFPSHLWIDPVVYADE